MSNEWRYISEDLGDGITRTYWLRTNMEGFDYCALQIRQHKPMTYFYTPPDNFMPGKALWLRKAAWFIRNPELHIIPTKDKVDTKTWNPNGGWWVIQKGWDYMPRFISYRGKYIEGYLGWRPSGSFGAAFRHANAKGY